MADAARLGRRPPLYLGEFTSATTPSMILRQKSATLQISVRTSGGPGVKKAKKLIPRQENHELYRMMLSRRLSHDNLMWQTPVLSVTALAFLFNIALGSTSSTTSRIISSILAVLVAAASVQLMAKHRHFEVAESRWLERYERRHTPCHPPHSPDHPLLRPMAGLPRMRSYVVWMTALLAFLAAGVATLFFAIFRPDLLQ